MRIRSLMAAFALLASGAWSQSSQAAVLFSDNFNSYAPQLDAVSASFAGNWTVPGPGDVDIIGAGTPYDYYPGNGHYIDLNGSNGSNGQLNTTMSFAAGNYTLTFNLGSSAGGANGNSDVSPKSTLISLGIGSFSQTIILNPFDGFLFESFSFFTTGGTLNFVSLPGGNPNVGNILDNVTVSSTPLPSTWAMLIAGFAGFGFLAYRGSKKSAAIAAA